MINTSQLIRSHVTCTTYKSHDISELCSMVQCGGARDAETSPFPGASEVARIPMTSVRRSDQHHLLHRRFLLLPTAESGNYSLFYNTLKLRLTLRLSSAKSCGSSIGKLRLACAELRFSRLMSNLVYRCKSGVNIPSLPPRTLFQSAYTNPILSVLSQSGTSSRPWA